MTARSELDKELVATIELMWAHQENLIQRVAELENRLGYGPDHDEALSPCDECDGRGEYYLIGRPEGQVCGWCNGVGRRWTPPWV